MKVPTKKNMCAIERFALDWEKNLARAQARSEIVEKQRIAREAQERLVQAELRTRRTIERQCRKSYFRKKYSVMGLWPLPPEGTPLNV